MAVTETMIAQLRRMVNEAAITTYTDAILTALLEARAVNDSRGIEPTILDFSTTPPTPKTNINWIPTYDLPATAADVWEEKAAAVACDFSFQADGSTMNRDQVYAQYMRQAQRYRSQSRPGSIKMIATTRERTQWGDVVETTPMIDRIEQDKAVNE